MSTARLNRLFDPRSGRALDVAVDHGLFGEPSFLPGIEDMASVISTLVAAGPDAVQLSIGTARLLQAHPGKQKPSLVLRADVANVYGAPLDRHLFSHHLPHAIEDAVRLDAVAVCVNLIQLPDRPEVREACIRSILELREQATRYGMPLMIEPLVMRGGEDGQGYAVDGDTAKIVTLVRQARELGADLIKADPTDDIHDYHRVIEVAGDVPVLVRGGGRVDDRTLLQRTADVRGSGRARHRLRAQRRAASRPRRNHAGAARRAARRRLGRRGARADRERRMTSARPVNVAIVGGGLMGARARAALQRWPALVDHPVEPRLVAVADLQESALEWFRQLPTVRRLVTDYRELLADDDIDVVYVAVRHDLHEQLYVDTIRAGKDLLAEKPFGIDGPAADRILAALAENPGSLRARLERVALTSRVPSGPIATYGPARSAASSGLATPSVTRATSIRRSPSTGSGRPATAATPAS